MNGSGSRKHYYYSKIACLLIVAGAIIGLIISCNGDQNNIIYRNDNISEPYEKVTLKDLISYPDKYRDKPIEFTGYVKYTEEISAIFPNKRKLKNSENNEALSLSFNIHFPLYNQKTKIKLFASIQAFEILNTKRVKVWGKYNPDSKGHLSLFAGTIGQTVYLEILN